MDPDLTKSIERDAVLRCQRGDREAFHTMMDIHGDRIFRTALLITRDKSLAEEAVQDALLLAWKKIRTFDADTDFRPWINRILINCIGAVNRRKRLPTAPVAEAMPIPDPGVSPETRVLNAETSCLLRSEINKLSLDHRTVLVLRYYDELSLSEIALATGWRTGTVKSRLHRATAALREALTGSESALATERFGEEARS